MLLLPWAHGYTVHVTLCTVDPLKSTDEIWACIHRLQPRLYRRLEDCKFKKCLGYRANAGPGWMF